MVFGLLLVMLSFFLGCGSRDWGAAYESESVVVAGLGGRGADLLGDGLPLLRVGSVAERGGVRRHEPRLRRRESAA